MAEEKKPDRSRQALNTRLSGYHEAAQKVLDAKVKLWERVREYQCGQHWSDGDPSDQQSNPSVQLSWYVTDTMLADLLKRPFDPSVVPEEGANFPEQSEQWERIKQQLAPIYQKLSRRFDKRTDNELGAEVLDAVLESLWERALVDDQVAPMAAAMEELIATAAWYSEAYALDGYDGENKLFNEPANWIDILHPSRVLRDPQAASLEQCRYICVKIPKTLREIWEMYPEYKEELQSAEQKGNRTGPDKKDDGVSGTDPSAIVDLEMWFLKDRTLTTATITETEERQAYAVDPMTGLPLMDPMGQPIPTIELVEVEREIDVPKYKGGYREIYRCRNTILADAEISTPNGRLPLHWMPFYKVPTEMLSMSPVEQIQALNTYADHALKYIWENASKTGQNRYAVDIASIDSMEEATTSSAGTFVKITPSQGRSVQDAIAPMHAMPLPDAHVATFNIAREMIETISGVMDMRNKENLPQDPSGVLLQEMNEGQHSRLNRVRARAERVAVQIAKNALANCIAYEEEEQVYRIGNAGATQYATLAPHDLEFDDYDFELRWDVVMDGGNLPNDPDRRRQFISAMAQELIAAPRYLADLLLDSYDLPNRERFEMMLDDHENAQKAAAQAQQEAMGQQPGPEQQAILKAREKAAGHVADTINDLAEEYVKKGQGMTAARLIAMLPSAMDAAMSGQGVDLSPFLPEEQEQGEEGLKPQESSLNGAQVSSMIEAVKAVSNGEIPRESGIGIIAVAYNLSMADAEQLLGDAGIGLPPVLPPAPGLPFGG